MTRFRGTLASTARAYWGGYAPDVGSVVGVNRIKEGWLLTVPGELNLARSLWGNISLAISQVADRDYQLRVWLGDVPDDRSSFVEAFYSIEGVDIDIVRKYRIPLQISDTAWELVLRFLVRFLAYYAEVEDVYAQDEILKDPHWGIVIAAAKDARDALQQ